MSLSKETCHSEPVGTLAWESVISFVGKRIATACFTGLAMTDCILQRVLFYSLFSLSVL